MRMILKLKQLLGRPTHDWNRMMLATSCLEQSLMMAMMEGGGDENGGGQLKLAVVTLGNCHLVSGAVTDDGNDEMGRR